MSLLLRAKKRKYFGKAYEEGLGMSRGDRIMISLTERRPGLGVIIAILLAAGIVSAIFLQADEKSEKIYRVLVVFILLSVLFASVFLIPLMLQFVSRRVERALGVAKCAKSEKELSSCGKKVRG